ncbi:transcriptional regulator [Candidatus Nitromaritima sp. SCGC AAA799-C22]|nr:transcriptional regulator [Candidatus Nitromaritima sp. SCGC AAA799-C22]KMP12045.1 transcriptional regulator [Candidatus Nitromaritima sp. SCGC AAA799-C22]
MPIISSFFGIIIRMFYSDHAPPHFHAAYGEHELLVEISPINILEGNAPARVRSMVLEWAAMHQTELLEDWERCQNAQTPFPIKPLE